MRKTITAATVAAALAAGGLAGAVLGTPALAGAATTATGTVGWVQDALQGLVDDGTIDQEQADAVATALEEARPERGHHGFRALLGLSVVADAVGVSQDDLRTALADGRTIAEVATENGVDVQAVVDAIVAAERARIDEAVAEGDLTRARADEILAGADERATAVVNGEVPGFRGGRHGRLDGPRGGGAWWHDREEREGDTDA